MSTKHVLPLIFITVAVFIAACEENDDSALRGIWISADKTDTLDFVDDRNFYRSSLNMRYDHYDYQLFKDSIEIRYNGRLYIYVKPTLHKYHLDGRRLTIDFSNRMCYGFPQKEITYIHE